MRHDTLTLVPRARRRPWGRLALLALVLGAGGRATTATAQSPNAFGIPTADQPVPASTIEAAPGSRAGGWRAQGRSEVVARHGMVATSDPIAAEAGLEILRRGGNAIDAAVAAGAVLDVTSQNDTGIGGDLFALVWSARDQAALRPERGRVGSGGLDPRILHRPARGRAGARARGVNAATVPGAVAGYDALLDRFGTVTFEEAFERAARTAEEGWGQAERRHRDLRAVAERLGEDPDSREAFLKEGQAPDLYSIIRNPDLGKALRLLQEKGKDAFYQGEIARGHCPEGARRTGG